MKLYIFKTIIIYFDLLCRTNVRWRQHMRVRRFLKLNNTIVLFNEEHCAFQYENIFYKLRYDRLMMSNANYNTIYLNTTS